MWYNQKIISMEYVVETFWVKKYIQQVSVYDADS